MFFHWWTRRKRRKLLATPFPDAWEAVLQENVAAYARLTTAEQKRIDEYLLVFIPEKNWEGCNGLAITPEIQATVAATVGLLTLGFDGEYFDQVQSILVYPQ